MHTDSAIPGGATGVVALRVAPSPNLQRQLINLSMCTMDRTNFRVLSLENLNDCAALGI